MRSRSLLAAAAAALACSTMATPTAGAAPAGALDPSFGGGALTMRFAAGENDRVIDHVVAKDGSVLALAELGAMPAVLRLTPAGRLDPGFGEAGIAKPALAINGAAALALDDEGRIVVAGSGWTGNQANGAVARLLPDGTPDASFDGDGVVQVSFGTTHQARFAAVAVRGDRIVAAGTYGSDVAVARLHDDGRLDASFSGDGKLVESVGGADGVAEVIEEPGTSRIVLVGDAGTGTPARLRPALMRLTADGEVDTSFGDGGKVILEVPGGEPTAWQRGYAGALDAEGRILVAGMDGIRPALLRFTAGGNLDVSFGDGGARAVGTSKQGGAFSSVAVQPDGAIVAGGRQVLGRPGISEAIVMRFDASGAPDPAFGTAGTAVVTPATSIGTNIVQTLRIGPDGHLTVSGTSAVEPDNDDGWLSATMFARLFGREVADAGDRDGAPPAPPAAPAAAAPAATAPGAVLPAAGMPSSSRPRSGPPATGATARPKVAGLRTTSRRISGAASGPVRRVEVAVVRRSGRRCLALRSTAGRFARAACGTPRWLRASGTRRWSLTLRRKLARGRYEVLVRAVGTGGRVGATVRRTFRVR
jgi:uncharacterized delta-60 repeat protein